MKKSSGISGRHTCIYTIQTQYLPWSNCAIASTMTKTALHLNLAIAKGSDEVTGIAIASSHVMGLNMQHLDHRDVKDYVYNQ